VAGELQRLAEAARALPQEFVEEHAEELADAATERLNTDTGGDASLSHAPADLSVEVNVEGGGSDVTGVVTAAGGSGQWSWLEQGTMPHENRGRLHPGHAGKGTWSDPVETEMRRLPFKAREAVERMMGA
jgi:hypothetical protein